MVTKASLKFYSEVPYMPFKSHLLYALCSCWGKELTLSVCDPIAHLLALLNPLRNSLSESLFGITYTSISEIFVFLSESQTLHFLESD